MTEKQFMSLLKKNLKGLSAEDRDEILSDYSNHFAVDKSKGRSEEDICESLGDPAQIGRSSKAELMVEGLDEESQAGMVFKAVIASFSLGLFNIIFVLGPYLGLVGAMIGFWAASIAIMVSGFATVVFIIFKPIFKLIFPYIMPVDGFGLSLAGFFAGIALFSLGSLAVLGMIKLTKLFSRGTVKYLKSNANIIKRSK